MPESHAVFGGTRALHELAMQCGRARAAAVHSSCQHGGRGGWRASVHREWGRLGRSSFAVNAPRFTAKLLSAPEKERRLRDAIAMACGAQVDWHGI